MTFSCTFDESLPAFHSFLLQFLSAEGLSDGLFLRDVSGRLSFFSNLNLSEEVKNEVNKNIPHRLSPYIDSSGAIRGTEDFLSRYVLENEGKRRTSVNGYWVSILDRRVVGADWQRLPATGKSASKRLAFASMKGGVGRSTAISVLATCFAQQGRKVLVIDLDLESPGIGSLLLDETNLPDFGAVDFFVEMNIGKVEYELIRGSIGVSSLLPGIGIIDVVPAVGKRTRQNPGNYLAKLSRAFSESVDALGNATTFAEKLIILCNELESQRDYDLTLIDVRAGLAETTAAPILSLGAHVLLFGTHQRQTIEDLELLFANLANLSSQVEENPWRRIKMVHAKAKIDQSIHEFRDSLWLLFSEYIYDELEGFEGFNFDARNPEAPHSPVVVPLDTMFTDWNPSRDPSLFQEQVVQRTFGSLISFVESFVQEHKP